jgi:hypothetical protein
MSLISENLRELYDKADANNFCTYLSQWEIYMGQPQNK